jgi:hypothetical protein
LGKTLKREKENEKWINENKLEFLLNGDLIINDQHCDSFKTLLPVTEKAIENLFCEDDFLSNAWRFLFQ